MRRPLVAGNWKMNGDLHLVMQVEECLAGAELNHLDVVICPPFPYLSSFTSEEIAIGGQNLSQFESGAHTGEVSGNMLKAVGCDYVIVGHSERRADNFETNALVADKVERALADDLTPILCVGEPLEIREAGELFAFISAQLDAVITHIGIQQMAKLVIAYEPVWAIGTGKTASPEQAQEVHQFIREHLASLDSGIAANMQILYGGSVKASNAAELFAQPDVDGGLIGGASLNPQDFLDICLAAK